MSLRTQATVRDSTRRRQAERRPVTVPGRIMWRDTRGSIRFAAVTTRDVSDLAVFVECQAAPEIPLYRMVYLHIDRDVDCHEHLPEPLRQGKVLSAVYRVAPRSVETGSPKGYALRLLVDPMAGPVCARPEIRSIA